MGVGNYTMFTCTFVSALAQVTHSIHIRPDQTVQDLRSVTHFHQRQHARDTEWNLFRRVQYVRATFPKQIHAHTHTHAHQLNYKFFLKRRIAQTVSSKQVKNRSAKIQQRQAQAKYKHSSKYENATEYSAKMCQRLALARLLLCCILQRFCLCQNIRRDCFKWSCPM